jgi:hypothetical protein
VRLTRGLAVAFAIAIVLAIAADVSLSLTGHQKALTVGGGAVGYWIVFTLLANLAIVYSSKWLGAQLVQRGHYDSSQDETHE